MHAYTCMHIMHVCIYALNKSECMHILTAISIICMAWLYMCISQESTACVYNTINTTNSLYKP